MKLLKLKTNRAIPTPKAIVEEDSKLELYGGDEKPKARIRVSLEPNMPYTTQRPELNFNTRYKTQELQEDIAETIESQEMLSGSPKIKNPDHTITTYPGTSKEQTYEAWSWWDMKNRSTNELASEITSLSDGGEERLYRAELYELAQNSTEEKINEDNFYDWSSNKTRLEYEQMIKGLWLTGLNEFEPEGQFYDEVTNLGDLGDVRGGEIRQGSQTLGYVDDNFDVENQQKQLDLDMVEGVLIPEKYTEKLSNYLKRFNTI